MSTLTTDTDLADIAAKVESGTRLTLEDGLSLFATSDIHTLGELANRVRERLHGRNAYYNVNRHINYTNYCVLRCKFCSFYRPYPKAGVSSGTKSAADSSPGGPKSAARGGETQYDFSPPPAELLAALLSETIKVGLFQCFIDAVVSEQVARMVAMKAATDAADDMIKMLSRQYNRARQSQITSELLDIIGGAEALK